MFVFSDDVFPGGRKVGIDGGTCTPVRVEPYPLPPGQEPQSATVNCVVSLQLRGGQLTTQGARGVSEQAGPSFTVAIKGGTRAYRTARGEASVTEGAEDNAPPKLRLPIDPLRRECERPRAPRLGAAAPVVRGSVR